MMSTGNVREILGGLIGQTLVDITQDDWAEVRARNPNPNRQVQHIHLHFADGSTVIFCSHANEGFSYDRIPKRPWQQPEEREPAEGAD